MNIKNFKNHGEIIRLLKEIFKEREYAFDLNITTKIFNNFVELYNYFEVTADDSVVGKIDYDKFIVNLEKEGILLTKDEAIYKIVPYICKALNKYDDILAKESRKLLLGVPTIIDKNKDKEEEDDMMNIISNLKDNKELMENVLKKCKEDKVGIKENLIGHVVNGFIEAVERSISESSFDIDKIYSEILKEKGININNKFVVIKNIMSAIDEIIIIDYMNLFEKAAEDKTKTKDKLDYKRILKNNKDLLKMVLEDMGFKDIIDEEMDLSPVQYTTNVIIDIFMRDDVNSYEDVYKIFNKFIMNSTSIKMSNAKLLKEFIKKVIDNVEKYLDKRLKELEKEIDEIPTELSKKDLEFLKYNPNINKDLYLKDKQATYMMNKISQSMDSLLKQPTSKDFIKHIIKGAEGVPYESLIEYSKDQIKKSMMIAEELGHTKMYEAGKCALDAIYGMPCMPQLSKNYEDAMISISADCDNNNLFHKDFLINTVIHKEFDKLLNDGLKEAGVIPGYTNGEKVISRMNVCNDLKERSLYKDWVKGSSMEKLIRRDSSLHLDETAKNLKNECMKSFHAGSNEITLKDPLPKLPEVYYLGDAETTEPYELKIPAFLLNRENRENGRNKFMECIHNHMQKDIVPESTYERIKQKYVLIGDRVEFVTKDEDIYIRSLISGINVEDGLISFCVLNGNEQPIDKIFKIEDITLIKKMKLHPQEKFSINRNIIERNNIKVGDNVNFVIRDNRLNNLKIFTDYKISSRSESTVKFEKPNGKEIVTVPIGILVAISNIKAKNIIKEKGIKLKDKIDFVTKDGKFHIHCKVGQINEKEIYVTEYPIGALVGTKANYLKYDISDILELFLVK